MFPAAAARVCVPQSVAVNNAEAMIAVCSGRDSSRAAAVVALCSP